MAKKKKSSPTDTADQLSFEAALTKLEEIVGQLEEGQLGLAESLGGYEEGVKHLKHCYRLLQEAERKIELLSGIDEEGNPLTEPLEVEATTLVEKAASRGRRRSRPASTVPEVGEAQDEADDDIDLPGSLF